MSLEKELIHCERGMNMCINPTSSSKDILLNTKNVNHMMELEQKLGDHQSNWDSSPGDREYTKCRSFIFFTHLKRSIGRLDFVFRHLRCWDVEIRHSCSQVKHGLGS